MHQDSEIHIPGRIRQEDLQRNTYHPKGSAGGLRQQRQHFSCTHIHRRNKGHEDDWPERGLRCGALEQKHTILLTMETSEIYRLRKEGQLKEAYLLAQKIIDNKPQDAEAKKAMAWVLYDYLKQQAKLKNMDGLTKVVDKIAGLGDPGHESFLFERVVETCSYTLYRLRSEDKLTDFPKRLALAVLHLAYARPSTIHSKWLETMLNYRSDPLAFLLFAKQWGIDLLLPNDFEKRKSKAGKSYCSLAESYVLFLAKAWLSVQASQNNNGKNALDISIVDVLAFVDKCLEKLPYNVFLQYYKARLLVFDNKTDQARLAMTEVVAQKPKDSWVWGAYAEIVEHNNDRILPLLCKGILCPVPDEMKIKLHEKLASVCSSLSLGREERYQLEKVVAIRKKNNWPNNQRLVNRLGELSDSTAMSRTEMDKFYREHAKQAETIVFSELPYWLGVVIEVQKNGNKTIIAYQREQDKKGRFRKNGLMAEPAIGQVARFYYSGCPKPTVLFWQETTENLPSGFVKNTRGHLKIPSGKNFGFVNDVFVPPTLMEQKATEKQDVKVVAIKSYDKAQKRWGWRAIKIMD